MKTKMKQLTASMVIILLILAGNANATKTGKAALSHETVETTLELEDWMVNDEFWNDNTIFTIETEAEAYLELEDWMTDTKTWEQLNINTTTDSEEELKVEQWMTSEKIW